VNIKAFLSLALITLSIQALAEPSLDLSVQSDRGEIEARFKGKKILVYAFATNQFKPYVRELYTLHGDNILRDAPADHLHHHGFMYAIRINGTNFWEEKELPGCEKSIRLLAHGVGQTAEGLPSASFTQLIHWVAPANRELSSTDAAALLIERRTIELVVDEAKEEIAVHWRADFEVGPDTKTITLHGSIYNGLGLRLPISFDHVAQFHNSQGESFSKEKNHELLPALWTGVTGKIGASEITAALFARAANAGESRFFAMVDPFAYLSATQNLSSKPLNYRTGQKFTIEYLLTVYPQKKDSSFLARRYAIWQGGK
jgi:hypothetical protein